MAVEQHQVVLVLDGEIDLSTERLLSHHIAEALARRPPCLVLDMHGVTFFGARGLGVVLAACGAAERMGCQLVVRGLSPTARRVFEAGGAASVLAAISGDPIPRRTSLA